MQAAQVPTTDVLTLAAKMAEGTVFLLDVREPHEAETARIAGAVLIPLAQVPQRLSEIPKDRPVVVQCHHGGRSARATAFLLQNGYDDVRNLAGGIDAWSVQVDPGVARY